jgi:hypothetical protein
VQLIWISVGAEISVVSVIHHVYTTVVLETSQTLKPPMPTINELDTCNSGYITSESTSRHSAPYHACIQFSRFVYQRGLLFHEQAPTWPRLIKIGAWKAYILRHVNTFVVNPHNSGFFDQLCLEWQRCRHLQVLLAVQKLIERNFWQRL